MCRGCFSLPVMHAQQPLKQIHSHWRAPSCCQQDPPSRNTLPTPNTSLLYFTSRVQTQGNACISEYYNACLCGFVHASGFLHMRGFVHAPVCREGMHACFSACMCRGFARTCIFLHVYFCAHMHVHFSVCM